MSRKLGFCFATLVLLFGFKSVVLCAAEEHVSEILTQNLLARLNGGTTQNYHSATTQDDDSQVGCIVLTPDGEHQGGKGAGEQPNIEDCAGESWAFHGVKPEVGFSDENDVVTQWFVSKFLGSEVESGVIKIEPNSRQPKKDKKQTIDGVKQAFTKVASNPVGRMLLYRILIEINRVDENGNPIQEYGVKSYRGIVYKPELREKGLDHRTCEMYVGSKWDFTIGEAKVGITVSDSVCSEYDPSILLIPVVDLSKDEKKPILKVLDSHSESLEEKSIFLFHEMVHWFHWLRCYEEFNHNLLFGHNNEILTPTDPLWAFWDAKGKNAVDQRSISPNIIPFWKSSGNGMDGPVREEILTICGNPENKLFGSELSENAYRFSIGKPLRYGHESVDSLPYSLFRITLTLNYQVLRRVADILSFDKH